MSGISQDELASQGLSTEEPVEAKDVPHFNFWDTRS